MKLIEALLILQHQDRIPNKTQWPRVKKAIDTVVNYISKTDEALYRKSPKSFTDNMECAD